MMDSFTNGSEMVSIMVGSGRSAGLSTSITSPRFSLTRYSTVGAGDGVTDPRVDHILDRRGHIADLARRQLLGGPRPGREPTDLVDVVDLAGVHHPDLGARDDLAVHDPDVRDDAAVRVVVRVE